MAMEVKVFWNEYSTHIIIICDNNEIELSKTNFMKLAGRISAMKDQILDAEREDMYPDEIKTDVDCPF